MKSKKRKKRMMQKIIPVIVAVALIIVIGGAAVAVELWDKYFGYSTEQVDMNGYYDIQNDSQAAIILNNEILEVKALMREGHAYLDYANVRELLNSRYYWDINENLLLVTTANDIVKTEIGTDVYSVSGEQIQMDHQLTMQEEDSLYISLDYIQKYTDYTYELFDSPNRIVVKNAWNSVNVADVSKESAVREFGGVKSSVLRPVEIGETLTVLEEMEEWDCVMTSDGMKGYIEKKHISPVRELQEADPLVYAGEEYTSIKKDYKINLAFHPIYGQGGNDTFDTYVDGTGTMSIICPTWFQLMDNEGGYANYASGAYVSKAHSRNMEVWAVLDNVNHPVDAVEIFGRTSKRERLIASLMSDIESNGIDGINLDIEMLNSDAVAGYVEFIRELSVACRQRGIVLSVDNYSPEGGANFGLSEQGRVVDYVILMGYDEHWGSGGVAGSVASIGFVERGIQMMLDNGVPSDKLINAIPFYTRVWKTNGGTVTSDALGMDRVQEFISQYNVPVEWDAETCQNYGEIEMGGILYQVWIEDKDSIETKLNVMKSYNLAGVGAWALGQENKGIWPTIDKYITGN